MIALPPDYEEIHEDAHVRCNVADGQAVDFVTPATRLDRDDIPVCDTCFQVPDE